MHKYIGVVIALVIICAGLIYYLTMEGFSTKREKSNAIVDWFGNTSERLRSYTKYRSDLGGKSNIYEYSAATQLSRSGALTTEALEREI